MKNSLFADRVLDFYKDLKVPGSLPLGVSAMNPYKNKKVLDYAKQFLKKYYSDNNKRVYILGINPGRFGGGVTGINFTDGFALKKYCAIENDLSNKRELSSVFIYDLISSFGGAKEFYKYFFLSAISPLGFVKNGNNYNYYDDGEFFTFIEKFIVTTLNEQIAFGADKSNVIILGTGKNQKYFDKLNSRNKLFDNIFTLEHPRYIMQYKRRDVKKYIEKYKATLKEVITRY